MNRPDELKQLRSNTRKMLQRAQMMQRRLEILDETGIGFEFGNVVWDLEHALATWEAWERKDELDQKPTERAGRSRVSRSKTIRAKRSQTTGQDAG